MLCKSTLYIQTIKHMKLSVCELSGHVHELKGEIPCIMYMYNVQLVLKEGNDFSKLKRKTSNNEIKQFIRDHKPWLKGFATVNGHIFKSHIYPYLCILVSVYLH